MLNTPKITTPDTQTNALKRAQNGAMSIFLTLMALTLALQSTSTPALANQQQSRPQSHLKLVIDNTKSTAAIGTQITAAQDPSPAKTPLLLPRKEDTLYNFLQLSSENILKSTTLDRALLAAHQLTFTKPENTQATEAQLLTTLNLTVEDIHLAQFFLKPENPPAETQNIANILTEFLARSAPQRFQMRFVLLTSGLRELSPTLQNTVMDQITPLILEHILTDPYLSLVAEMKLPLNFKPAQETRNQLIETFDALASDTQKRLLYFELYEHFRTVKTDATAPLSQANQLLAKKMAPLLKSDATLARTFKTTLLHKSQNLNTIVLDSLDHWYSIFVAQRLISAEEHQDVVALYKQYLNTWVTRPYVVAYPNFENRLERYLGFLEKDAQINFTENYLINILNSHNFLTDYKFETQENVAKESYKIYLKLFDLVTKNRTQEEIKSFLFKIVPAYMTSLPHYKVPNIDLENRLIAEIKNQFAEHNAERAHLLDILDRSVTAASQRYPRLLKELRPIFNDDFQQTQRFDKFYTHVLRNQVRSKAMMPNLQPDAFREAQNELFYLSRVLPAPQYYDFLSSLLTEFRHYTKKLPNPFLQELEYEFSTFKGQRPKDRPHLKLIDCRRLISK